MAVDNKSRFDVFEKGIKAAGENINFNLLYYKFPYVEGDKFLFYQKNRGKDQTPKDKKWLLGQEPKPNERDEYKNFFEQKFIKKVQEQHYKAIESLGYHLSDYYENEPDWRLIVGLGTQSVYEVGMTLHHTYGIPYIPATAIKGALRSYWIEEKCEGNEGLAIEEKEFCDLFGCPNEINLKDGGDKSKTYKSFYNKGEDKGFRKGQIIYFDAFPTEVPTISPDIMNNHYPEYYDGAKKPPADWQSPNPISFLTVKKTKFKFVLGLKKYENYNPDLLNKTMSLLKEALEWNGIGAKTTVGYGYIFDDEAIHDSGEMIDCEIKPKAKPSFFQNRNLNPKKRYIMQGVITKTGRPNLMDVYVKEGEIHSEIKVDGTRNLLEEGTIIEVEVQVNKKKQVVQASLRGIIK